MSARLNKTVVSGGVLYPAGTEATDKLRAKIPNPAHWDDLEESENGDPLLSDHPNTALLREVVAFLAERHLQDVETPISDLVIEAQHEFGLADVLDQGSSDEPAQAQVEPIDPPIEEPLGDQDPSAEAPEPVDYSTLDIEALKAEIDKRNDSRPDEAKLSKRGGKDTLVAALLADDQGA